MLSTIRKVINPRSLVVVQPFVFDSVVLRGKAVLYYTGKGFSSHKEKAKRFRDIEEVNRFFGYDIREQKDFLVVNTPSHGISQ